MFIAARAALIIIFLTSYAGAFEVWVSPKNPMGGEAVRVSLSGKTTGYYEISFNGKKYLPYGAGENRSQIFLPIPIEARGKKQLVIENITAAGAESKRTVVLSIRKRPENVIRIDAGGEKMRSDQPMIDEQNARLLEKIRTMSSERLWGKSFIRPLKAPVSTVFAKKRVASSYAYYHKGVDFSAPTGTPVKAMNSGVVVHEASGLNVYGNALVVDHGQGITSCYFHLDRTLKKLGDSVAAGEVIAEVGATGWATGPHLHFGVYVQGEAVDPLWWLRFTNPKPAPRAGGVKKTR